MHTCSSLTKRNAINRHLTGFHKYLGPVSMNPFINKRAGLQPPKVRLKHVPFRGRATCSLPAVPRFPPVQPATGSKHGDCRPWWLQRWVKKEALTSVKSLWDIFRGEDRLPVQHPRPGRRFRITKNGRQTALQLFERLRTPSCRLLPSRFAVYRFLFLAPRFFLWRLCLNLGKYS